MQCTNVKKQCAYEEYFMFYLPCYTPNISCTAYLRTSYTTETDDDRDN